MYNIYIERTVNIVRGQLFLMYIYIYNGIYIMEGMVVKGHYSVSVMIRESLRW